MLELIRGINVYIDTINIKRSFFAFVFRASEWQFKITSFRSDVHREDTDKSESKRSRLDPNALPEHNKNNAQRNCLIAIRRFSRRISCKFGLYLFFFFRPPPFDAIVQGLFQHKLMSRSVYTDNNRVNWPTWRRRACGVKLLNTPCVSYAYRPRTAGSVPRDFNKFGFVIFLFFSSVQFSFDFAAGLFFGNSRSKREYEVWQ